MSNDPATLGDHTRVTLRVSGDKALFSRPELSVDRVSCDVITPLAARGILDWLHWRPAIRWIVSRIHVLNPVRFETLRQESGARIVLLRDVDYLIDAHFAFTDRQGPRDTPRAHHSMFSRAVSRLPKGSPYLGHHLFHAAVSLLDPAESAPRGANMGRDVDLGLMLHDFDYSDDGGMRFFRARMIDGVIDVPSPGDEALFR